MVDGATVPIDHHTPVAPAVAVALEAVARGLAVHSRSRSCAERRLREVRVLEP